MKRIEDMSVDEMKDEIWEFYNTGFKSDKNFVFVSYSHSNSKEVFGKVLTWIREGYNIYIDVDFELNPSDVNWVKIMRDHLRTRACKLMVCFRSRQYYRSHAALVELLTARSDETIKKREKRQTNKKIEMDIIKMSEMVDIDKLPDDERKELINKYNKMKNKNEYFLQNNDMEKDLLIEGLDSMLNILRSNPNKSDGIGNSESGENYYDDLNEAFLDQYDNYFSILAKTMHDFFDAYDLNGNIKDFDVKEEVRFDKLEIYRSERTGEEKEEKAETLEKAEKAEKAEKPSADTSEVNVASGAVSYALYGEEFTHNHTDFMANVIEKVLLKHPEMVPGIVNMNGLSCLSQTDYSKENKDGKVPGFLRQCRYLPSVGICVGTNMVIDEKIKRVALVIKYCNEAKDILKIKNDSLRTEYEAYYDNGPQINDVKDNESMKKSGKKASSTGDISYVLYGKDYTHNQSDFMVNVFAKVLKRHPDMIPQIVDMAGMFCLSTMDYTKEDNKKDGYPSVFRTGDFLPLKDGIFVGTCINIDNKIKKIALVILHCKESIDILEIKDDSLQEDLIAYYNKQKEKVDNSESGELQLTKGRGSENGEIYSICGKESMGNQTQMMVDTMRYIVEKHFDLREKLADSLTCFALAGKEDLKGIPYFNSGESFQYDGVVYSIGTSYGRAQKLDQIRRAIAICNENYDDFQIDGLEEKMPSSVGTRRKEKKNFLDD